MTQPLRIFISYKRDNQSFAEELRQRLIVWEYSTWMDIYDIPKGANWPDEIDAGLQASDVVIGVMSPQAVGSRNVKNEWDWAIVNHKRLIPLMLEHCAVPMNYVSINYIDFTRDKNHGFGQLESALKTPRADPAPADPYRPYLEKLYERINTYLAQKIVPTLRDDEDRPEPIRLRSEATHNAVLFEKRQEIDPLFTIGGIQTDETTEKEQVYDDFERAFNHYGGRVLLLGEPGAGKTITLLHFGRDAFVRRIQDPTQPLPILLIVPTWDMEKHKSLAEWVSQSYEAPENAAQLIEEGKALLMLDGLDELGGKREEPLTDGLRKLLQRFEPDVVSEDDTNNRKLVRYDPRKWFMGLIPFENQLVVTCRVEDYREIGEKISLKGAVTLKPLDAAQMRTYLAKQPELMAAIEKDSGLREMLSTPLLLSFFAFAYQDMTDGERQQLTDLSKSPGDLRDMIFKKYIAQRYEHERRKPNVNLLYTVEQMYEVFGAEAMKEVSGQNPIYFRRLRDERFVSLINQGYALNILVRPDWAYADGAPLGFIHLRLRDHFAFKTSVAALSAKDADIRRQAAVALGQIGDARAVAPLINALNDTNADVRRESVTALGRIGDTRAYEPLLTALHDSDQFVRREVVSVIAKIGGAHAVDTLITVLHDTDQYTKVRAVVALGEIKDIRSVKPLLTALSDNESELRSEVTQALVKIGGPAFETLLNALGDANPNVRQMAAAALGEIDGRRAIEYLRNALGDVDANVRISAAEVLGQLGNLSGVETLIAIWQDTSVDIRVRISAAAALGRIGDPRAVQPLINALNDVNERIRGIAAAALGRIGDPRAVQPLINALSDKSSDVSEWAAYALRFFHTPEALAAVKQWYREQRN